jgi:hypothetical protein
MKFVDFPGHRPRFKFPVLGALALATALCGWPGQAAAEAVDSELLLLIDITPRGLDRQEFDQLMDGYADAITSTQVMDSIQSGSYGRIAVSLMFYGNSFVQQVGIPWMSIGSSAEAETFAILLREVSRPFSIGSPALDDALTAALGSFGSETGGADNGFQSVAQIVEVAAATVPLFGNPADTAAARDQALASGVDAINVITLGDRAAALENYYSTHVVGGETGGVVATSSSSAIDQALGGILADRMSGHVGAGAAASLTSVPEPSTALALISGLALLACRRRRLL